MDKRSYFVLAMLSVLLSASVPMEAATIGGRFYPLFTEAQASHQPIDSMVGHFDHKINYIFSDIDGTMLPFNKSTKSVEFPQSVNQAVERLHSRNIPLILTTGRSYREAKDVAHRIGNEGTYLITQQGAQIVNPQGDVIYQDDIKKSDFPKILKKIEAFEKLHNTTVDVAVFTEKDVYSKTCTTLPCVWEKITPIKTYNEVLDKNVCKIAISDQNTQKLKLVKDYLSKYFPHYNIVISGEYFCDVSSKTATKGNAIKRLAKILNADLKNAAVLGDAENDLSMFQLIRSHGGMAIATGNAMAVTKYNANYITSTVYANGFAKAIDKILLNNAKLMVSEKF